MLLIPFYFVNNNFLYQYAQNSDENEIFRICCFPDTSHSRDSYPRPLFGMKQINEGCRIVIVLPVRNVDGDDAPPRATVEQSKVISDGNRRVERLSGVIHLDD